MDPSFPGVTKQKPDGYSSTLGDPVSNPRENTKGPNSKLSKSSITQTTETSIVPLVLSTKQRSRVAQSNFGLFGLIFYIQSMFHEEGSLQ